MAVISFVDGKEVEWGDGTILIDGADATLKCVGFDFGVDVELEHLYGGDDDPIGIQGGNRKPSGTLSFLKGNFDAFDFAAIAAGGRDVTDIVFQFTAHYKPKGTRPPITEVLTSCRISKWNTKMTQGDKKMIVELPFLFLKRKKV